MANARWTDAEYRAAIRQLVAEGYSDEDIMALVAKVRAGFTAAEDAHREYERQQEDARSSTMGMAPDRQLAL